MWTFSSQGTARDGKHPTWRGDGTARRERSRHSRKGQPSDITQHGDTRDAASDREKWKVTQRRRAIRGSEWVDLQMRRKNRVQGCGEAQDSEMQEKADYKRYRKSGCSVLTGYKYNKAEKVNSWCLEQKCSTRERGSFRHPRVMPTRTIDSGHMLMKEVSSSSPNSNKHVWGVHWPAQRRRRWKERGLRGRTAGWRRWLKALECLWRQEKLNNRKQKTLEFLLSSESNRFVKIPKNKAGSKNAL